MRRKPSATSSRRARDPVRRGHGLRRARANFVRTTSASSGSSPPRSEHVRKQCRVELADHHVAVGHRQRTAAAIGRGAGIGAGRLRPDAKARAVERADRAAAGRDRVDAHHRRAQPHARDLGHERALVLAGPVRDVGGRAAHVEADDPVEARLPRHLDRADDAARGSGQDRVLALEEMRVGQAAARLHELQANAAVAAAARQLALDLLAHSGAGSATGRRRPPSCRRATRASSAGSPRATPRPAESRSRAPAPRAPVRAPDSGSRASARSPPRGCRRPTRRADPASARRKVERRHHVAVRADALVDLDHALVRASPAARSGARRASGGSGRRCAARRRSRA